MKQSEELKKIYKSYCVEAEANYLNEEYDAFVNASAYKDTGGTDPKTALMYACLGLAGEVGECLEHVKKGIRDTKDVVTPMSLDRLDKFHDELGDVLWYVTRLANLTGWSLEVLQHHNMTKLIKKHEDKEANDN